MAGIAGIGHALLTRSCVPWVARIIAALLFAWKVLPAVGMNFHPGTIAHAIGVASSTFTSYRLHRHHTFSGAIGRTGA